MTDHLLLIFILLCGGVIAVPIATRLGLGSVLGYLLAGIALSPLLQWLDVDVEAIQHLAEFGVVIMLFLVGLELQPDLLWRMRTRLLGLGGLQVAITTLAVAAVALAFGMSWQVSLAIGLVLCLSSTAIVLQTLNEKGLMRQDGGQAGFAVLLFQDIAVIPMLALLPLLATIDLAAAHHGAADDGHGGGLSLVAGLNAWQAGLVTIAAIAAVIFIGRRLAAPIFRWIAATRVRELFTATALMMVVGVALLMSLVGLSPALGTFLAGVMLAESEYRHELESDIEPFRGLLLGVFFITVGASINFALLYSELGLILGLTLGLILLKALVLLVLSLIFQIKGADRWLFALGLAQAGEFGFVLLAFTVGQGVLPDAIADPLLLVVALSMLITPLLFIAHEKLIAPRFLHGQKRKADAIEQECEVIIAGHGRFGGIVNRMLRGLGYETTVIDYSSEQLEILRAYDIRVYFGDATRPDLLKAAGIERARLLVIAIDDKDQTTELVGYVARHHPEVHVIARAFDRFHVYELYAAGCRDIIRETYDSSLRAGRSALEALGLNREDAEQKTRTFEALDRRSMIELAELHRLGEPNHLNPEYTAKAKEMRDLMEAQLRGESEPEG
ncbi:monovalent cation:proton antiporter-2 (CPA2) family protein [Maricaulis parjimensis]|uniref:monovalent cation:proton antiporter-2 (CPA2) family protein n=1 Tax=Maricaulis parjimensis TaxID=144023 RepID=UPI00193A56F9|nr:monovalent cation:proton antiporter-2 (CPA2) family protein [Maricaulis parjimensis]